MSLPNRSTKLKVAFGYILLTALLFISIGYIYQEMKSLSGTGDDEAILSQRRHVTNQIISQLYQAEVIGQSLSTGQIEQYYRYQRAMKQATTALDSLRTLLTDSIQLARLDTVGMLFMDKERNMRNLLKAIQDGGTDILYKQHIDELIAQQDSLLSLPHVRKKVITHTNSYIIRKKPKSFFKRLGEVFSPGKADSTQVNNVIQEEYTDTLTEAYSPSDTVVTMLKNIQSRVTDTQQERMEMVNRRTQSLRLSGLKLSQKVNQLLSTIEEECKVVINGAGSAGVAITKLLLTYGFKNVTMCDKSGILSKNSEGLNWMQKSMMDVTNLEGKTGSLADALAGADVFVGVSAPNIVTADMVKTMNKDAIIFAMANPVPEIMPDVAKAAGARVVGTGRSDFPNQVNNVIAFPGIFKGALEGRARQITEDMKLAAALAIANLVPDDEVSDVNILPEAFDPRVADVVSKAVIDHIEK
mgnify:CR=1 FL=1